MLWYIMCIIENNVYYTTGRGGRVGRAQVSCAEDREFRSQSSQANDLKMYIVVA